MQANSDIDTSDALERTAGDLRQARAELSHLQELAAEELEEQMASVDLGSEAIANSADLELSLPSGFAAPVRIHIRIDAETGRASWSTPDVGLDPIGGRRQLALTAALRVLAETVTGALPASAFDRADG